MKTVGVITVLVALSMCAEARGKFFPDRTAKPCCAPDQLQGTMSEMIAFSTTEGTQAGEEVVYIPTIYIDYENRKAAGTEIVYYNGMLAANLTFLTFFDSQTYVVNNTNGNCTVYPTPAVNSQLSQCVPDDAKFLGSMTIGYGIQSLKLNTWEATMAADGTRVTAQTCLTSFTCMPVMGSFEGTSDGYQFVGNWLLSNMTTPIIDPSSAFAIPSACSSVNSLTASKTSPKNLPRGRGGQQNMLHYFALLKFLQK